jgi:hypothetical protein
MPDAYVNHFGIKIPPETQNNSCILFRGPQLQQDGTPSKMMAHGPSSLSNIAVANITMVLTMKI